MCRMLGIVSKDGIIPFIWLDKFRCLARRGKVPPGTQRGHLDGWDLAGYISNGAEYMGRSFRGVNIDRLLYQEAAKKVIEQGTSILLGHLRKTSRGETKIENTHPFKSKDWLFCHNGTIYNHEDIPLQYNPTSGDTDSERFFLFLLEEIGEKKQFSKKLVGIKNAIHYIWNNNEYTSLTFLLSDGENLWAYRDFNERYKRGDYTREELDEYYTLYYAKQKKGFVVCSEILQIPQLEWKKMVNGELIAVNQKGKVLMNEFL